MTILDSLAAALGRGAVLTGADRAPWARDWTGKYASDPLCVLRPADTAQVAAALRIASGAGVPVVPISGNTGLTGGGAADGAIVLSLDRMARIRGINAAARTATVEAGVVLSDLHAAAAGEGLCFPVTFGARGSARIGGILSTNAGGSNVLRHGTARDLCLGLEVVLADGRVLDLMSALHKDNSGLPLRQLFLGSEGQLGVITAAVLKLKPAPAAHATATVACARLSDALTLLNRLQEATGGAVEAFEFMPRGYIEGHLAHIPGAREPFAAPHPVTLLVEVAAGRAGDALAGPDGSLPVVALLEGTLAALLDEGLLADAVIARSEAQRAEMWARREAAAEIVRHLLPQVDNDVCLPLDRVEPFLTDALARVRRLDPGARDFVVAHLGDGNVHYTVLPSRDDPALAEAIREAVEDAVAALGGSFSAEHGIGLAKLGTMRRRKDPVALDVMRTLKAALDPGRILNPGKVIPD